MHFGLRKAASAFAAGMVIFWCSCEKHHLGEMPDAQKEHVDVASESGEASPAPEETSASSTPSATSTPAELFPESPPSP
jgi:hypothetical protein